jgi:hypothetical protein
MPGTFKGLIDLQMIFYSTSTDNILDVVLNAIKNCKIVYSQIN